MQIISFYILFYRKCYQTIFFIEIFLLLDALILFKIQYSLLFMLENYGNFGGFLYKINCYKYNCWIFSLIIISPTNFDKNHWPINLQVNYNKFFFLIQEAQAISQ